MSSAQATEQAPGEALNREAETLFDKPAAGAEGNTVEICPTIFAAASRAIELGILKDATVDAMVERLITEAAIGHKLRAEKAAA